MRRGITLRQGEGEDEDGAVAAGGRGGRGGVEAFLVEVAGNGDGGGVAVRFEVGAQLEGPKVG